MHQTPCFLAQGGFSTAEQATQSWMLKLSEWATQPLAGSWGHKYQAGGLNIGPLDTAPYRYCKICMHHTLASMNYPVCLPSVALRSQTLAYASDGLFVNDWVWPGPACQCLSLNAATVPLHAPGLCSSKLALTATNSTMVIVDCWTLCAAFSQKVFSTLLALISACPQLTYLLLAMSELSPCSICTCMRTMCHKQAQSPSPCMLSFTNTGYTDPLYLSLGSLWLFVVLGFVVLGQQAQASPRPGGGGVPFWCSLRFFSLLVIHVFD